MEKKTFIAFLFLFGYHLSVQAVPQQLRQDKKETIPRIVNNPPSEEQANVDDAEEEKIPDDEKYPIVDTHHAAQLTELALLKDLSGCLQLTYCTVGASLQRDDEKDHLDTDPTLTMASGILASVSTFRSILERTSNAGRQLPQIRQLVASFDLGDITRDAELCRKAFQCSKEPTHFRLRPIGKSLWARRSTLNHSQRHHDCISIKAICPGISAGCSMCHLLREKSCEKSCSVGEIFCDPQLTQC